MRTMYDAVEPGNIPAGATMVAGYVDGAYANVPAMRARFPHARVVTIAVKRTTRAMVADVEQGDLSPEDAVFWCTHTMADTPNDELTVYCNTSTWPAVVEAFKLAGVTLPQWWAAHYDDVATLPAGAVAKQYKTTSGWDESVVANYWPGVDPKPAPPAKPKVSLKNVVYAAEHDPKAAQGHTSHPADVKPVEAALLAEGLLAAAYARDGSFGSLTVDAYAAWQRRCGYSGSDANGIPGQASLTKLGEKHGFTVGA
jgi:hypothetical protein